MTNTQKQLTPGEMLGLAGRVEKWRELDPNRFNSHKSYEGLCLGIELLISRGLSHYSLNATFNGFTLGRIEKEYDQKYVWDSDTYREVSEGQFGEKLIQLYRRAGCSSDFDKDDATKREKEAEMYINQFLRPALG